MIKSIHSIWELDLLKVVHSPLTCFFSSSFLLIVVGCLGRWVVFASAPLFWHALKINDSRKNREETKTKSTRINLYTSSSLLHYNRKWTEDEWETKRQRKHWQWWRVVMAALVWGGSQMDGIQSGFCCQISIVCSSNPQKSWHFSLSLFRQDHFIQFIIVSI